MYFSSTSHTWLPIDAQPGLSLNNWHFFCRQILNEVVNVALDKLTQENSFRALACWSVKESCEGQTCFTLFFCVLGLTRSECAWERTLCWLPHPHENKSSPAKMCMIAFQKRYKTKVLAVCGHQRTCGFPPPPPQDQDC